MGANVQAGQDVVVTCLVEHAEIAREMTREAYRAGAQHVIVLYSDLHLRRAAIELGPEEELGWSPPYLLDWVRRWGEERPALIALTGNPDPDLLSRPRPCARREADPRDIRAAYARASSARSGSTGRSSPRRTRAGRRRSSASPTSSACGTPSASAIRLDEPDPVAAWRGAHGALEGEAAALNERRIRRDPVPGPGTDLTIGLSPGLPLDGARRSRPRPGSSTSRTCRPRRSSRLRTGAAPQGHVRSTAPLVAAGARVSGLEVRFEGGKIVDVTASDGRGDHPAAARDRRAGGLPGRDRARRRLLRGQANRPRLLRHALRRERGLPHRLRRRGSGRPSSWSEGTAREDAPRARRQRLRRSTRTS